MQAVILAAGASSRFWPLSANRHKSLFRVGGQTLLEHTLDGLAGSAVDSVVIVQSPDRTIEDELGDDQPVDVSFVVQDEPKGMAHALRQAEDLLDEPFFVMTPYRANGAKFIEQIIEAHADGADAVLLGKRTDTPWKYGVLETDGDRAVSIVEKPEEGEQPSDERVVGIYLLEPGFFQYLDEVDEHEYQYEDALDLYMDDNVVRVQRTEARTESIKYPWDLFGVVETVFDEMERHISPHADIDDSATIDGDVVIEDDVTVYENAVVRGPCYIGEGSTVGNNAVVREYTDLEAGCVVGANSEVRGSLFQEDTHVHDAFVGDSILGRDVRVGAGTVVANRNARKDGNRPSISVHLELKDRTVDTERDRLGMLVGDGADIGTQANIMPGVAIGPDSFVGPSTMLKSNVAAGETIYTEFTYRRRDG
jgi:bifunctional UDP-N-acetylglucosamine pyrophosphorylase/glucosamine-1-phosphate N-acetyltransferase